MANPFRLEHWNLLAGLVNNFKDVVGLGDIDYRSFTIHDALVQADFTIYQTNDWFAHGDVWSTSRQELWDTSDINIESQSARWSRNLLDPMEGRINELYGKGWPYGVPVNPWPSDVSKLTTSMIQGLRASCHWSPFEWTAKWVYDTFGNTYTTVNPPYYGDLHYSVYDGYPAEIYVMQPHTGSVQVFPPDLIQGATLDWIIPHTTFDNYAVRLPAQPSKVYEFDYLPSETTLYKAVKSYPIQADGSCSLTQYTSGPYSFIRGLSRTAFWDNGEETYPDWTCLAVNLENAEFI